MIADWRKDIFEELQKFSAEVKFINEYQLKFLNHFIFLADEKTNKIISSNNDIIVHHDIYFNRRHQVLMRLKSIAGLNSKSIHGRQTKVVLAPKDIAKKFVDKNHLMGYSGGRIHIALMYRDVIVAVGVFSKPLWMKYENPPYYSAELERFCSLSDTTVTGGLDKIIKHYFKSYQTDDIVTTVDLEWSNGDTFIKQGFTVVTKTEPLLFAINKTDLTRRIILSQTDKQLNEYLTGNRGNLKLRKRNQSNK